MFRMQPELKLEVRSLRLGNKELSIPSAPKRSHSCTSLSTYLQTSCRRRICDHDRESRTSRRCFLLNCLEDIHYNCSIEFCKLANLVVRYSQRLPKSMAHPLESLCHQVCPIPQVANTPSSSIALRQSIPQVPVNFPHCL